MARPDPGPVPDAVAAEVDALAALLDAAAEDLDRNGPVSPADLRDALAALDAEWGASPGDDPTAGARTGAARTAP
jgi:hypothetical protein